MTWGPIQINLCGSGAVDRDFVDDKTTHGLDVQGRDRLDTLRVLLPTRYLLRNRLPSSDILADLLSRTPKYHRTLKTMPGAIQFGHRLPQPVYSRPGNCSVMVPGRGLRGTNMAVQAFAVGQRRRVYSTTFRHASHMARILREASQVYGNPSGASWCRRCDVECPEEHLAAWALSRDGPGNCCRCC